MTKSRSFRLISSSTYEPIDRDSISRVPGLGGAGAGDAPGARRQASTGGEVAARQVRKNWPPTDVREPTASLSWNRAVAPRSTEVCEMSKRFCDPDARAVGVEGGHLAGGEELHVGAVDHVVADGGAAGEPLARMPVAGKAAGEPVGRLIGQFREELGRGVEPAAHDLGQVAARRAAAVDRQEAVVVLDEPGVARQEAERGVHVERLGDVGVDVGPDGVLLEGVGPELIVRDGAADRPHRVFLDLRQAERPDLVLVGAGDEVGDLVAAAARRWRRSSGAGPPCRDGSRGC